MNLELDKVYAEIGRLHLQIMVQAEEIAKLQSQLISAGQLATKSVIQAVESGNKDA